MRNVFFGAHLVLELPGPLQVRAFGEFDLGGDGALRFLDETDDVAVAHVELHVGAQQAVFAFDHHRPFDHAHAGHVGQVNRGLPGLARGGDGGRRAAHRTGAFGASARRDQDVLDRILIDPVIAGVTQANGGNARAPRRWW